MPKQDRMQATLDDGTQNDLALAAEGLFPFLGPIDRRQSVSPVRVPRHGPGLAGWGFC
jgi:hypothetical protein